MRCEAKYVVPGTEITAQCHRESGHKGLCNVYPIMGLDQFRAFRNDPAGAAGHTRETMPGAQAVPKQSRRH
jgi:hypothetical protein